MKDFHYNCIKNKYGDKAWMFLADSDSLVYKTEAENIYEDFSNYPKDLKLQWCK